VVEIGGASRLRRWRGQGEAKGVMNWMVAVRSQQI
jgi:hypothetical protein